MVDKLADAYCYSNTTLVKVKLKSWIQEVLYQNDSNTTLVKVKSYVLHKDFFFFVIQIQHLLKLNDTGREELKEMYTFKYNTC